MKIHIVQKGDTLWKLAKHYGVNFEELKKLNSQLSNPDMIMPGMKIKIPNPNASASKEGSAKIKYGVKKEAPIHGGAVKEVPLSSQLAGQKETVKEQPIMKEAPIVKEQPIVKEAPIVKEKPIVKEAPIVKEKPIVKEQPIVKEAPIVKEKPIVKEAPLPQKPIMKEAPKTKPVVPEIDINNYYLVNMNKMKPAPVNVPLMPQKPTNIMKPMKEESPESPVVQAPIAQPECIPITPLMPGTGFCPPCHPWAFPMVQGAMYQHMPMPMMEESPSSMESSSFIMGGTFPGHQQPYGMQQPPFGHMPPMPYPGMNQPQAYQYSVPQAQGLPSFVPHKYQVESSSLGESSSHMMGHQMMPFGHQMPFGNVMPMNVAGAQYEQEEDCGCGDYESPESSSMVQGAGAAPQIPMPQQMGYPQTGLDGMQMPGGQMPFMGGQQPAAGQMLFMGGQQPAAGQMPFMGGQQPAAGQMPFMGGQQPAAGQMPFMGGQQPVAGQMPFMGGQQPVAGQMPFMGGQQPPAGQMPFMGGQQPSGGQMPFMGGQQPSGGQMPFMGGQQPSGGQMPFMGGQQPAAGQMPFMGGQQPPTGQMPFTGTGQPYPGMMQQGTMQNFPGMFPGSSQMPVNPQTFEMPRFADESSEYER
nr:SafA/ExsA family spore coat assembly protein [Peribacillus acanthi]